MVGSDSAKRKVIHENSQPVWEQMTSSKKRLHISMCGKSYIIADASGLTSLHLSFSFFSSVSFSHSAAEEAEAAVQGECGGQEAQAAESTERSKQSRFLLCSLQ